MLLQMELSIKQGLASVKYQNPDVTRKHIMNALECYRGLSFKMEPFVFNDGRSMELASLQGTIPVKYKAFSTDYTKTLANLSGTIPVLITGVVYHIPICIWLMDTHPNHAPLCFVKPTSDMQIKMSMYVDHNGKIYLPYLHNWSPATSDILGVIQIMILTFGEHPPVYSKPRSDNPAPYPQQVFMPMPGVSTGHHTPYPPYPPVLGPQNPPTPYFPHYPPANQKLVRSEEVQNSTSTGSSSGTITDEHIRASLLSAVEHKLKRRIDEQFAQSRAELEILQQSAAELNQGKTKLDGILDKLNREKSELERNITLLKEKDAELEKAISQLEEQNDIDVDEAVTTTAPLYKQILNAYAEEAATEDAIYYMGEALRRSVIDLDVFLKQVRSLSRKQFMLRALMQKCRQKAGLAG